MEIKFILYLQEHCESKINQDLWWLNEISFISKFDVDYILLQNNKLSLVARYFWKLLISTIGSVILVGTWSCLKVSRRSLLEPCCVWIDQARTLRCEPILDLFTLGHRKLPWVLLLLLLLMLRWTGHTGILTIEGWGLACWWTGRWWRTVAVIVNIVHGRGWSSQTSLGLLLVLGSSVLKPNLNLK